MNLKDPKVQHLVKELRRAELKEQEAERLGDAEEAKRMRKLQRTTLRAIERKTRPKSDAALEREERKKALKEEKRRAKTALYAAKLRAKALAAMQAPSKPAKPRKPLAQGKPLPAVNKTRAAALREQQFSLADGYRDYIVGLPCVRCRKPAPSDPAHMVKRSRGGGPETMLPLCRECHIYQEVNNAQFAEEFQQRQGITPLEMARALRAAYLLAKETP